MDVIWGRQGFRTHVATIHTSLLGGEGSISFPEVRSLALHFGEDDPQDVMQAMLQSIGVDDAEKLRDRWPLPPAMIVRVDAGLTPLHVQTAPAEEVLHRALLLGLCSSVVYDPSRPVLWTRASLTRRVRLYDASRFYA